MVAAVGPSVGAVATAVVVSVTSDVGSVGSAVEPAAASTVQPTVAAAVGVVVDEQTIVVSHFTSAWHCRNA